MNIYEYWTSSRNYNFITPQLISFKTRKLYLGPKISLRSKQCLLIWTLSYLYNIWFPQLNLILILCKDTHFFYSKVNKMESFYIYAFIKLSIQVSHWINSGFKGLGDKNRSNCLLVKISKKCHPFVFNHDPPPLRKRNLYG